MVLSELMRPVVNLGNQFNILLEERQIAEGLGNLLETQTRRGTYHIRQNSMTHFSKYFDQKNIIKDKSFILNIPIDYVKRNISITRSQKVLKKKSKPSSLNQSVEQSNPTVEETKVDADIVKKKIDRIMRIRDVKVTNQEGCITSENALKAPKKPDPPSTSPLYHADQLFYKSGGYPPVQSFLGKPTRRHHIRAKTYMPFSKQEALKEVTECLEDILQSDIKNLKENAGCLALTSPDIEVRQIEAIEQLREQNTKRSFQIGLKLHKKRQQNQELFNVFEESLNATIEN